MKKSAVKKNTIIGLKELRNNLDQYIERINKGESLTIVRRSSPIFKMSPVDDEEGWETIDFTKIRKGGVPAEEVLEALRKLNG